MAKLNKRSLNDLKLEKTKSGNVISDIQRTLSIAEVCILLGISRPTLNQLRKKGLITGTKIGSKVKFLECDIFNFLKQKTEDYYEK